MTFPVIVDTLPVHAMPYMSHSMHCSAAAVLLPVHVMKGLCYYGWSLYANQLFHQFQY